jgi:hypothetical protein
MTCAIFIVPCTLYYSGHTLYYKLYTLYLQVAYAILQVIYTIKNSLNAEVAGSNPGTAMFFFFFSLNLSPRYLIDRSFTTYPPIEFFDIGDHTLYLQWIYVIL